VLTTALGDVTDTRDYGDFEDLTHFGAAFNGTSMFDVQLTQDDLGRVVARTETIGGVTRTLTYVYDAASRLAEIHQNGGTIASYAYDANGNRLSLTTSGGTVNGTYDAQDHLLQYGTTSFDYDAAGQLTTKTVGGQTTTYAYDETGNLLEVNLPSGTVVEYVIDGANRRIGRKVNGTLTEGFLYQDRVRPIAALDGGGNVVSRFVYALPGIAPDFMIKGGATFRIVTDPIGSPRLVVDVATGTIAQRMNYDEFGNVTLDTNPGFQPFGFAGGLYDPATKLVRFGLRDYDAATGRFTAKDPALVAEESLYAYGANDPVNQVDRLGRAPNDWDDWLKDETADVIQGGLKWDDPLAPKETQVFESRNIRKAIEELAADAKAIGLLRKLDDIAEFAAKKLAPPAKICIFVITAVGLADRAEAADRNIVDQILVEQSPVEPEVGAAAIRSGAESILGPIKDAIKGAFEDLFQRPF
jgi:RHS repeat-associated protein